jgi:hypothetical protein
MALQHESIWIEPTELLALIAGAFMFRAQNWARWLALVWMASSSSGRQPLAIILALIAWVLFRPDARRYFIPLKPDYE